METILIAGQRHEIGVCDCDDNTSLIVGEHCDVCGKAVVSELA